MSGLGVHPFGCTPSFVQARTSSIFRALRGTTRTAPSATDLGFSGQKCRVRCSSGHKTRLLTAPPTPHATQPRTIRQNRRVRCSPCTQSGLHTSQVSSSRWQVGQGHHVLFAEPAHLTTGSIKRADACGCRIDVEGVDVEAQAHLPVRGHVKRLCMVRVKVCA